MLDELRRRGLLHQATEPDRLRAHLAEAPRTVYCGFDPTADSLTIGNLVPIMLLRHFQRHGHRPIVLVGGATGLIGDPSGKEAERALRTADEVRANCDGQRRIYERLLEFDGPAAARLVDNLDWIGSIRWIDALRDIGKHFSVNQMIQRDSVRKRLEDREHGISYTEFSYMLLQAYDFLHLYRTHGCTVQTAGSDQWGNIVSGIDLIRREFGLDADGGNLAFGLTAPLVTRADGGKFGKTEGGAVWLTADRTSPYAFYQFWLNTADADVGQYLGVFTQLDGEECAALARAARDAPQDRAAQRRLAREVTAMVHGDDAMRQAEAAGRALFTGDLSALDAATLDEVFAEAPGTDHARDRLAGDGAPLVEVLAETSLAKSRSEARRLLESGSITVNGERAGLDSRLTAAHLLHGRVALLRRGKKSWHVTRWG